MDPLLLIHLCKVNRFFSGNHYIDLLINLMHSANMILYQYVLLII